MQPSYKTKHLLLTQGGLSSKDSFSATGQLPCFPHESLESEWEWEWETANRYYFKSMASVHVLRHICLNFHKDFTLEQVDLLFGGHDVLVVGQVEALVVLSCWFLPQDKIFRQEKLELKLVLYRNYNVSSAWGKPKKQLLWPPKCWHKFWAPHYISYTKSKKKKDASSWCIY